MKKVLIFEDSVAIQGIYKKGLGTTVTIISARSLEEAEKVWEANQDADLIVMDGCIDNPDTADSLSLTRQIRESYEGPIIAASGSSEIRKKLMETGCSHDSDGKDKVPQLVIKLLGLPT